VFPVIAYNANLLLIRRNKTKNQEQTNAKKQNEVKKECKKRNKERRKKK
jgi:hypothetical protein